MFQTLRDELDGINRQIDKLGLLRGDKNAGLVKRQMEVEGLLTAQAEFKVLKRQWRVYETLVSAYAKKGLPSQILDKLLPAINAELSSILSDVADIGCRNTFSRRGWLVFTSPSCAVMSCLYQSCQQARPDRAIGVARNSLARPSSRSASLAAWSGMRPRLR